MKTIVLGAGGLLGSAVARAAPGDVHLVALGHRDLDITDEAVLAARIELERPDWVLNCAAWSRVDAAESHQAEAMRVNADAVGALGRAAAQHGARVLHVSTDYVFDGALGRPYREDDTPYPASAYGRSKLAGEVALASSGAEWLVVRTQWLYGRRGNSFARTVWERAARGEPARVVNDQRGAPTHVDELANALWALVDVAAQGMVHVTAAGEATWFDVALRIYARRGRAELVTPIASGDWPAPARRPADGRLDCTRFHALTGQTMRGWEEPLEEYLEWLDRGD